ncbi:atp-dependent rna helicase mss116 [Neofusicoccum parvum]|uniref:Atp-dependent rna helicase mss116 n=2 Tax=Neofusicoccum parvum TaxID=310453 RepID=A0ACB5SQ50_9PEZI|nr:putative dead box rna helicase protein [Neofusicoccum parvum UCRNP2]GME50209.1 atp-dependent rna helicase mss116 [Neofusicoccum parvum]GME59266.1 atp-dependent rna helicase mss116 [Neofusicoccum parvum]
MLAPLRRCPASLPRALRTAAATRSALRNASTALPRTVLSSSRIVPLLSTRAFQLSARPAEAQVAATQSSKSSRSHSPITNFQELEDRNIVHPNVIKAIVKDMGITTMTEVQSATLHQALQGTDL